MIRTRTRLSWVYAALLGTLWSLSAAYRAEAQGYELTPLCPILDTPPETFFGMSAGYAPSAPTSAEGWDDVSMISASVWGEILFLENDLGGEFVTQLYWDNKILQGYDGSSSGYPLTMADVYLQYAQRYVNGFGLRLDAAPGFYGVLDEMSGDAFAVPCGATLIKNFGPGYALFGGASVYPGFDVTVDPRLGMRWKSHAMLCDLAYPETRLTFLPTRYTRVYFGGRYLAWPEYAMGDDERETLRYREVKLFGGVGFGIAETVRLTLEGGYLMERQIEFEANSDDVDVDDGAYFGLDLSWLM